MSAAKRITEERNTMFNWRAALAAFATWGTLGLVPDTAMAEPAIKAITSTQQAGGEVVRIDRKSTRLNSSHEWISRMPSSA